MLSRRYRDWSLSRKGYAQWDSIFSILRSSILINKVALPCFYFCSLSQIFRDLFRLHNLTFNVNCVENAKRDSSILNYQETLFTFKSVEARN
jgi:hypothetical protein